MARSRRQVLAAAAFGLGGAQAAQPPKKQPVGSAIRGVKPARSYFGAIGFRRLGQLLQTDCIAYVD